MALQMASGSFVTPTVTGQFTVNYVDQAAQAFLGKVLFLWGGAHVSALGHHKDVNVSFGYAVSATQQACISAASDDLGLGFHSQGVPGDCSDVSQLNSFSVCYAEIRAPVGNVVPTPNQWVQLKHVSWGNGTVTLDQIVATNPGHRVFYWIWGGSDVEDAAVVTYDIPAHSDTVNSPQPPITATISGLPFTPTLLFALQNHSGGTFGVTQRGAINLGIAQSATKQIGFTSFSVDELPTHINCAGWLHSQRLTFAWLKPVITGPTGHYETEFTGFTTNGFTLKVHRCFPQAGWTVMRASALLLKGPLQAALGTFQQRTTVGTQDVTGLAFQPAAVLFLSRGWLPAPAPAPVPEGYMNAGHHGCIGLATGSANQRVTSWEQPWRHQSPLLAESSGSESECLQIIKAGESPTLGTIRSRAALTSFLSTGFRLNWTEINVENQLWDSNYDPSRVGPDDLDLVSVDATAREYAYLALAGGGTGGGGGPVNYTGPNIVLTSTGPSVQFSGLAANTRYEAIVEARDAVPNTSVASLPILLATPAGADVTAPTAPSGLGGATTTTTAALTWTGSTDTESGVGLYHVERALGQGAFSEIATVSHPTVEFTDAGPLTSNTLYRYRVRAGDLATTPNLSGYSNSVSLTTQAVTDTTPPSVPGEPLISNPTSSSLTVSWEPSTDDSGGPLTYQLYRATLDPVTGEPGTFAQVSPGPNTATTYTDTGLTPQTGYAYRVTATDPSSNVSDVSPVSQGTTMEQSTTRLARQFTNAGHLQVTAWALTGYPITVTRWFKPNAGNFTGFIWAASNPTTDRDYLALKAQLVSGVLRLQAMRVSTAVAGFPAAQAVDPFQLNVWQLCVGVFTQTGCEAYVIPLGGVVPAPGIDSTVVAMPTGITTMAEGACVRATLTTNQRGWGSLTDGPLWSAALTVSELAVLASGQSPRRVRRQNLDYYNHVNGEVPEVPEIGTGTYTQVGTVGTEDGPEIELLLTDPVIDDAPPSIPQNPAPVEATGTTLTFSWGASADVGTAGLGGYRVRQRTALGTPPTLALDVGAAVLTATLQGLQPFTTYYLTIAAFDTVGNESGESQTLIMTTRPTHGTAASGRDLRTVITPRT